MRKIISISSVSLLLLAPFALPQATKTPTPVSPRGPSVAAGSQGVVVSGRPAATAAGIKILEQGGNAADAGAATLLALSVTYVGAFCVGGEVPISGLQRWPEKRPEKREAARGTRRGPSRSQSGRLVHEARNPGR